MFWLIFILVLFFLAHDGRWRDVWNFFFDRREYEGQKLVELADIRSPYMFTSDGWRCRKHSMDHCNTCGPEPFTAGSSWQWPE